MAVAALPAGQAPAAVAPLTLVLGGARSGKSRHAEALAESSGLRLVYVATAEARDREMMDRIARHRARRDGRWTTLEAPLELAATLAAEAAPDRVVLVDCLTLWLSNVLLAGRPVDADMDRLLRAPGGRAGGAVL